MKLKHCLRTMLVLALTIALILPNVVEAEAATLSISKEKATLEVDAKVKLTVKGNSSKVKWSTSDKTVATVSKGTVTAKSEGVATITAKSGKSSVSCTVVVVDNNKKEVIGIADAKVSEYSVFTADGGYFVTKLSKLNFTFKLSASTTGAELLITDAIDEVILDHTFGTIKAGKDVAYTWNGKCEDGSYATAGTYFIKLKAGSIVNDLGTITVQSDKDFAGGNGSEDNPFKIETIDQLKKISKYANANFIQTRDIDCNYEPVQNLFSNDLRFNGSYNGNGYKIKNCNNTGSIFGYIGENGSLKNVKIVNASVNGRDAILCNTNYGTISGCEIDGSVASNSTYDDAIGIQYNYGTISKCSVTGSIYCYTSDSVEYLLASGFVYKNYSSGKIIDCHSSANVKCAETYKYSRGGKSNSAGLIGYNYGMVISSYFDGTLNGASYNFTIAYQNDGTLQDCYYDGDGSYNAVRYQNGIIK